MDLYAVPYSFPAAAETCIPILVGRLPMPPPSQRRQGPVLSAQISVRASATSGHGVTRALHHWTPAARVPAGACGQGPAAVPRQVPRLPPGQPFPTRQASIRILRTRPPGLHSPSQVQVGPGASKSSVTGPGPVAMIGAITQKLRRLCRNYAEFKQIMHKLRRNYGLGITDWADWDLQGPGTGTARLQSPLSHCQ